MTVSFLDGEFDLGRRSLLCPNGNHFKDDEELDALDEELEDEEDDDDLDDADDDEDFDADFDDPSEEVDEEDDEEDDDDWDDDEDDDDSEEDLSDCFFVRPVEFGRLLVLTWTGTQVSDYIAVFTLQELRDGQEESCEEENGKALEEGQARTDEESDRRGGGVLKECGREGQGQAEEMITLGRRHALRLLTGDEAHPVRIGWASSALGLRS